MSRTAIRTCPLCEATCGLALEVEGERVVAVRGDREDVFSGGYLCPKGALFGDLELDPDRLDAPRVRRGGELVPTTWDEAIGTVAARLRPIIEQHGPDAVAFYLGNPNVHTLAGQLYLRPAVKAIGTRNVFTASSVDQMPKQVACGYLFGDPVAVPVPDIDRTDLLVILGGNPRVSNGSLWTAPNLPGRLTDLRRRGGRLVVVDPRRTRTADRADQHLAIQPGTDALLLAAMVSHLDTADRVRLPSHLDGQVDGLAEALSSLRPFTPERVAERCGIPAASIRELADEVAAADRAAVYGRLGTTTTRFGTLTSWLVDIVNLVTGNLDVPGGAMFPLPAPHRPTRRPFSTGRWHSRVAELPEALGELPAATLLDEITTPGEGQVRALITVAGNPVLSTPGGDELDRALPGLDLMVSIDPHINATTRHADVVLPPPSALHRSHLDLAFAGLSVRNVVNYSPPVFPPDPDRPDEWEILVQLAAIGLGATPPVDVEAADHVVAQRLAAALVTDPGARTGEHAADDLLGLVDGRRGPERLLDLLLRAGPYGDGFGEVAGGLDLGTLEANPHGVDLGPLEPQLPGLLGTASGHIETTAGGMLDQIAALSATLDDTTPPLVLIGRRHLRTNNSWSHNVPGLIKDGQLCTLLLHPDDADRHDLQDGRPARVRSSAGELEVMVEISDEMRPGVASLPHGFGHDLPGVELSTATKVGGVNSNTLTDRQVLDGPTGTAVLNGIPIEVTSSR